MPIVVHVEMYPIHRPSIFTPILIVASATCHHCSMYSVFFCMFSRHRASKLHKSSNDTNIDVGFIVRRNLMSDLLVAMNTSIRSDRYSRAVYYEAATTLSIRLFIGTCRSLALYNLRVRPSTPRSRTSHSQRSRSNSWGDYQNLSYTAPWQAGRPRLKRRCKMAAHAHSSIQRRRSRKGSRWTGR